MGRESSFKGELDFLNKAKVYTLSASKIYSYKVYPMKFFTLISIIFPFLFISCSSDFPEESFSLDGVPVISIDTENAEELSMNNFESDISFLELMVPDEIIFRLIKRVKLDLNSVFVLEYGIQGDSPRLFSFNLEGKLNFIIDKPGQGPGEYERFFISIFMKIT